MFTPKELLRYSRQILLPDLKMEGQQRLKSGSILVIGAGGLGSPALYALIARCNESAGGVNFNTQYEVPIVYQGSSPEVVYMKGNPAQLECEFHALWDSALGFGRLRSQTVVAS